MGTETSRNTMRDSVTIQDLSTSAENPEHKDILRNAGWSNLS